ncbi:MAG: hypothetical protein H6559_15585 [Lewinellaceae bacterium]|nr:hypothetical protein [Lewinellaceae bacterium]
MRSNSRKKLPEFPIPEILASQETTSALGDIVEHVDKNAINPNIYKGQFKDPATKEDRFLVRERLKGIYYNKCAYCEDIQNKPEVEHYRPKKKLSEDRNHPGYYWLCYEWTNLLPACHYCNTDKGKRNQFSIRGIRVSAPPRLPDGSWNQSANDASVSPLIDEEPYLLHPEIDQPDDGSYFKFHNTGEMEGIDPKERGEKTIEICDLNREDLLEKRREKIVLVIELIRGFLVLWSEGLLTVDGLARALDSIVFTKMVKLQGPDQPFSLLSIYIFEHFNEIIVPELPTPAQRTVVSAAFADFRVRFKRQQRYYRNLNLMLGSDD